MKKFFVVVGRFIFLIASLFLLTTCHKGASEKFVHKFDLEQINRRGKLIAVTDFSPINYFVYRGQPMGYQYELLQEYANSVGMKIEVVVCKDLDKTVHMLRTGEADLIALNYTITNERRKFVEFTVPHSRTRQVLVQRKPGIENNAGEVSTVSLIRDINELSADHVVIAVQKSSAAAKRLRHLSDEMGDSLEVNEMPLDDEELIEMVSTGEIDYAVCDENVAKVCQTYCSNIDCETPVSFSQNLAWAVRKDSPDLLVSINTWMEQFSKTAQFAVIYNKYFRNPRFPEMVNSDYFVTRTGRISAYDDLLKEYSEKINWDWVLLASVVYQESHFNPQARSWAGAFGLMQIMPSVKEHFGNHDITSPEKNISTGVKLIGWIDQQLDNRIEKEDRIRFILAAYNIGYGHIEDAMRLTEKYGRDPFRWEGNVEYFLAKKNKAQYYKDPVVRNGYCKGSLAVRYVDEVLARYDHYLNFTAIKTNTRIAESRKTHSGS